MTGVVLRADARSIPLPDESVDLVVTSPPYFALRSYRDGDEHYEGQIGSEATPADFLDALWTCTAEWWRVLKPAGSLWVNLGDKYAGSGGHNNGGISSKSTLSGNGHKGGVGKAGENKIKRTPRADGGGEERRATQRDAARRNAPDSYNKATIGGARDKSLMGLPWRYANGCVDGLAAPCASCGHVGRHDRYLAFVGRVGCRGCHCIDHRPQSWILRAEVVWSKPNGLPESVTDRVRRSHEQWFHLVKQPRYFAAVDEVREPHAPKTLTHRGGGKAWGNGENPDNNSADAGARTPNPLGKLPGSVWTVASEPLVVRDEVKARLDLPDHFAAFPTEWPRRIILGWSPSGICTACGEGRRPVVDKDQERYRDAGSTGRPKSQDLGGSRGTGRNGVGYPQTRETATITGYACACTPVVEIEEPVGLPPGIEHADDYDGPAESVRRKRVYDLTGWTPPPTRPAVVLDPFGGTGTVAMVAKVLGRVGISVDLSGDYCRLARWRIEESGHAAKAASRTDAERQGVLV